MTSAQLLKKLGGKTIREAEVTRTEASDSCVFATFELRFTDGTQFSFQLRGMPAIEAVYFKGDLEDNAANAVLVKP
jgi:hypothetical protein